MKKTFSHVCCSWNKKVHLLHLVHTQRKYNFHLYFFFCGKNWISFQYVLIKNSNFFVIIYKPHIIWKWQFFLSCFISFTLLLLPLFYFAVGKKIVHTEIYIFFSICCKIILYFFFFKFITMTKSVFFFV